MTPLKTEGKLETWQTALSFALTFLVAFIAFRDYLFGQSLYVFKDIGSDTVTTFLPQLYHISGYLAEEGWPTWSFAQGMGQNIFPFAMSDPFNDVLYLTGKDNLIYYIAWFEALKLSVAALFFYGFLRELSLRWEAALAGGIFFGFSGFMLIGSAWYVFSIEGVYLALLLWAFERSLNGRHGLLPLSIGLIAAAQPVNLLPMGLFMIPYAIFRYVEKQEVWAWKPFFKWLGVLIFSAVLGLALSSFFLANELLMLAQSPRVGGESSMFKHLLSSPVFAPMGEHLRITTAARFFGNDLLGQGSKFTGWYNYLEAPALYCGLATLILIPQFFAQASKRERLMYGGFLAFFVAALFFPFFRRLFFGFSGDYYRMFGLLVSLLAIFLGARAWSGLLEGKKLNLPLFALGLVLAFGLLFYPKTGNIMSDKGTPFALKVDTTVRNLAAILLLVHGILLFFSTQVTGKTRQTMQYASLGLMALEAAIFASISTHGRPVISKDEAQQKVGYNDYTKDAVAFLKEQDKGFFRLSKNYQSGVAIHSSMNDAKAQDYFGTASYSSFNQKYYIEFLTKMGAINPRDENQTRWAPGLETRPLLQIWASTKYRLLRGLSPEQMQGAAGPNFKAIKQLGDVSIYENPNFVPFGFTYAYRIDTATLSQLQPVERDIAILQAGAIEGPCDLPILPKDSLFKAEQYSLERLTANTAALRSEALQISKFSNKHIVGQIEVKTPKFICFSTPYDAGWAAKLNGQTVEIQRVNFGFWGFMLPAGRHDIELEYHLPYAGPSLGASLAALALLLGFWFWAWRYGKGI